MMVSKKVDGVGYKAFYPKNAGYLIRRAQAGQVESISIDVLSDGSADIEVYFDNGDILYAAWGSAEVFLGLLGRPCLSGVPLTYRSAALGTVTFPAR